MILRLSTFQACLLSSSPSKTAATIAGTTRVAEKQKGRHVFNPSSSSIDSTSTVTTDQTLIPFFFSPFSQQPLPEKDNRDFSLLDTGSFAGNFIARRIVIKLNLTRYISITSKKVSTVFSGLDKHCHDISDTRDWTLSYFCPDLSNFSFDDIHHHSPTSHHHHLDHRHLSLPICVRG